MASPVPTYTYDHPVLKSLTGRLVENDTTVHFRSIPYATIPARFRPSILLDHIPEQFDTRPHRVYTDYGNACPGRSHGSNNLKGEVECTYDELTCCNVTVSVSKTRLHALAAGDNVHVKPVPVMVYIHGGAFVEGAGHVSAMHDTSRMVGLSEKEGEEVVIVSIGYRLGAFAFLVGNDILADAKAHNEHDEVFNLGLYDQRKALLWVRNNIGGFGGDKDRITLFGESAGSCSISMHLLANEPLFSRCVMQSGNVMTSGEMMSFEEFDGVYERLVDYFGIKGETPGERVEKLRNVPADDLWKGYAAIEESAKFPYLSTQTTFFEKMEEEAVYMIHAELTAKRDWLDAVIVGDDFFEGYIFFGPLENAHHLTFVGVMKDAFGEEYGKKILNSYGIETDEEMDPVAFYVKLMTLVGDVFFSVPTDNMAKTLSKNWYAQENERRQKVFRYNFCLPNVFPGSPFSYVTGHHFVELFYLFMTFRERFPTHRNGFYARQSEEMARRWIRFANGKDPWEEYRGEDGWKIAICDDLKGWVTRTREKDEEISKLDPWGERRYQQWQVLEDAFADLHRKGGHKVVEAARRKISNSIRKPL